MASGAGHPAGSFEAALSSLRRERAERSVGAGGKPSAAAFFFADGNAPCGFAAAAERAFEDYGDQKSRPKPLPSDTPEAIASELALKGIADPAELRRMRRRFMWENHPDRRPDLPRDLTNRRVAVANMLIDRALTKI